MELTTVWFALITILWIGYFCLEGFDFGVGMLLPILARNENERRVLINTIGPVWDGNEVWLLVAGGATFAAFPEWYATLFSGFYLPLLLILVALIVRGLAFEYRAKRDDVRWRARWDAAIIVGSLFLFVIVGNVIAAPFNSALSEAIEAHLTGRAPANVPGAFTGAMRGVLTALGRLALFVLLYPPILATQFIPVVGILLQPVLAALYGSFVLSLDFSDPTFERHLPRFRDRVGYIGRHKARYLGFGLTAVAMALVPIVNFLLLPVGVAAAAMLYLEGEEVIVGISHDE